MYYFLDIDGVLNTKSDWCNPYTVRMSLVENFLSLIREDKDAKVVLSSTWRANPDKIGQYIPIYDVTPSSNKTRQEEIEYYIRRHQVDRYIILDDDESLFPHIERLNIYLVDYRKGLTVEDVKKIKRMIK